MTLTQSLFLGILQGLTEFLPVSSSGHLVLAETWLNIHLAPDVLLSFNIILHAGTLLALLIVYRERWWQIVHGLLGNNQTGRKLFIQLVVATIPAGIAGLLFEDAIATRFSTVPVVAGLFLVTAAVLILGERSRKNNQTDTLKMRDLLVIGLSQACALLPGISRSGFTASAARMSGLSRSEALDFSFLLAAPIIGGATLLTLKDFINGEIVTLSTDIMVIGFAAAACSSGLAILVLRQFVRRYPLSWFAAYLVPLGLGILFFS